MAQVQAYPNCSLTLKLTLYEFDANESKVMPLDSGDVQWLLAANNEPDTPPAADTMRGAADYSGNDGVWFVTIPGSMLKAAQCRALFKEGTIYLVVYKEGLRVSIACKYNDFTRPVLAS